MSRPSAVRSADRAAIVVLAMWIVSVRADRRGRRPRPSTAAAGPAGTQEVSGFLTSGPETWTSPQGLTSAMQVMLLLPC